MFIFYFTLILPVFTLQHFNSFSHTRIFICTTVHVIFYFFKYILFYSGLFTITIFTKQFFFIIIIIFSFFLHGQYTPRGPDNYMAKGKGKSSKVEELLCNLGPGG